MEDAELEQQLIDAELQKDMQIAQANQAFSEANVQPNMSAQGATNAMLNKQYMGKTPVAETVGGFEAPAPGEAPPEEAAPESSGLLELFVEFFSEVPLKGKVWLAGNVVTDPTYSPQSPNWNGVEVFLEKLSDKSAINQRMRDQYQSVWGNLTYHQGPPSQDEPSLLVYDPEGESEMPDDFGMEEEPAEMMGAPEMGGAPPEMGVV